MESFEERVHKELKSKNINNKNYLWLITFLICAVSITYYSYTHQTGVIAKQSIEKEFTVKNQETLQELFKEHLSNPERRYQNEEKEQSLYDSAAMIVQPQLPEHEQMLEEDPTFDAHKGPEVEVNDEQIAQADIPLTSPEVQQEQSNMATDTAIAKVEEQNRLTTLPAVQQPQIKVSQQEAVIEHPIQETSQNNSKVLALPNEKEAVIEKVIQKDSPEVPKTVAIVTAPIELKEPIQKKVDETAIQKEEIAFVEEPQRDFELIKCYNLKSNESELTIICQDKISSFLQEHKSASKFEVIGIIDLVDEKDVINDTKYKNVYILGEDRVKKAKAFIQKNLGDKVSILEQNYTLKTELEYRGVVIRAYN
ncbi:hypothetical protein [Candidatus Marinarcus aquaticus]|uniref:Uncharacterized protein n=1 Tax=Candidatus Marinarcus aquaticus TaxID=2044504 RepID=A0A4Q0XVA3_9BACT|nr:hypothetical protein [Candidatus Marinarcus aquaticus]RXJ60504.1 hypothetical protein CRV04_00370 [Candidatus Marinarcus aquaticus]